MNGNNIKIVDTNVGRMMVNDLDQYVSKSLILYGQYAPAEEAIFKDAVRKHTIVVEVGANIGASTLQLAKLAKYVYAFEPVPYLYHMLCGNLALNEVQNVQALRIAGGEVAGTSYLPDIDYNNSTNLGCYGLVEEQSERTVNVMPILLDCGFLKIDVEGYELQVLKGATPMIKRCMPIMLIENDRPQNHDELIGYINKLGYKAYWHCFSLYSPHNFNNNTNDAFGEVGAINVICVDKNISVPGQKEAKVGETWDKVVFQQ